MGLIYQATNLINEKSYIGQTIFTLEKRMITHKKDSKYEKCYFHRAINKYDFDNFKWEILYECENNYLDFIEEFFIRAFDTFNCGYNSTTGGEGGYIRSDKTKKLMSIAAKKRIGDKNSFFGKKHSDKTKEKLRKICKKNSNPISFWKGKKLSEEHKRNIGLGVKGEKNGFFGKKHTEKTKRKISEARKRRDKK